MVSVACTCSLRCRAFALKMCEGTSFCALTPLGALERAGACFCPRENHQITQVSISHVYRLYPRTLGGGSDIYAQERKWYQSCLEPSTILNNLYRLMACLRGGERRQRACARRGGAGSGPPPHSHSASFRTHFYSHKDHQPHLLEYRYEYLSILYQFWCTGLTCGLMGSSCPGESC